MCSTPCSSKWALPVSSRKQCQPQALQAGSITSLLLKHACCRFTIVVCLCSFDPAAQDRNLEEDLPSLVAVLFLLQRSGSMLSSAFPLSWP